uniref:Cytochrome c oxidase subunit 6B2 n=1 Tax=Saimiri boliviensis boliviensis TaxID=39432 RepID=A0A2K6SLK7_SAIBB
MLGSASVGDCPEEPSSASQRGAARLVGARTDLEGVGPSLEGAGRDYQRCVKTMSRRGKNSEPCEYYFRVYNSLCPTSWVQNWNEQIKDGTFAGKI